VAGGTRIKCTWNPLYHHPAVTGERAALPAIASFSFGGATWASGTVIADRTLLLMKERRNPGIEPDCFDEVIKSRLARLPSVSHVGGGHPPGLITQDLERRPEHPTATRSCRTWGVGCTTPTEQCGVRATGIPVYLSGAEWRLEVCIFLAPGLSKPPNGIPAQAYFPLA
jgi:hypothetical protein